MDFGIRSSHVPGCRDVGALVGGTGSEVDVVDEGVEDENL